jgi:hypothetical protein
MRTGWPGRAHVRPSTRNLGRLPLQPCLCPAPLARDPSRVAHLRRALCRRESGDDPVAGPAAEPFVGDPRRHALHVRAAHQEHQLALRLGVCRGPALSGGLGSARVDEDHALWARSGFSSGESGASSPSRSVPRRVLSWSRLSSPPVCGASGWTSFWEVSISGSGPWVGRCCRRPSSGFLSPGSLLPGARAAGHGFCRLACCSPHLSSDSVR